MCLVLLYFAEDSYVANHIGEEGSDSDEVIWWQRERAWCEREGIECCGILFKSIIVSVCCAVLLGL